MDDTYEFTVCGLNKHRLRKVPNFNSTESVSIANRNNQDSSKAWYSCWDLLINEYSSSSFGGSIRELLNKRATATSDDGQETGEVRSAVGKWIAGIIRNCDVRGEGKDRELICDLKR